jgi:hypothetical protein
MKSKVQLLLYIILFLSFTQIMAQEKKSEFKRAQNIFVELGGQGVLFTANYDSRFSNKRDGLGGRVGLGYISEGGYRATTVPVSLNYLLGKDKHFFEIGLGTTLFITGENNESFTFNDSNSAFVGTMSFSYRLQPIDHGFSFRAGLTPIFNKDFFIPYYAGLSIGYSF